MKLELFLLKEIDIETISQVSTVTKNLNNSGDEKDRSKLNTEGIEYS